MDKRQIDIVRSLKAAGQKDGGSKNILIKNASGAVIGTLAPVDEELINDQLLLAAFTSWRKKFKHNFLTQFEPTIERTRKWLSEVVLKDDTRILFVILDSNGKAVGHCGVCNILEHQAELDNVLRGEKAGDPDFMFHAAMAVLGWLRGAMGIDRVVLHVFSNNEKAINLYKKLRFSERQRFNLSKVQEGEDIRYLVGSDKGDPADFQYIEMILECSPKFTVIIPTRERPDVLLHCLRTVVAQDYGDLTIIVSDNFSQDNTKQVVESFHDARIKYINTGKRVSMSHNYEFALGHVSGGWVAIVGDDDGLLPGALTTIAEIIKKTGCQAIISDVCRYNWPGTQDNEDCLVVPLNQGIELRNSRVWLDKALRGDANYMDLPYLYTGGFINFQAINKARSSDGSFYASFNPDVYSAIALASVLDDYVVVKEPVAVAGLSSHSIGASAIGTKKFQDPGQKFLSEKNIPFHKKLIHKDWPKDIPRSISIYVYECYLQSVHLHHDFLKVEMAAQLGLALSRCAPGEHEALRKYCVEITQRNGVDMLTVDRHEKACRRWQYFKHCKERIYRSFNYRVLSGKEFGIHDVYEASMLARAVFLFETRYAGWRFKKFFQGIKKVFKI